MKVMPLKNKKTYEKLNLLTISLIINYYQKTIIRDYCMNISEKLRELNLISGNGISKVFDDLYQDILTIEYHSESKLLNELWKKYKLNYTGNPSLNGAVFEVLTAIILYRSNVLPFYTQASLAFVPNINFDFVIYSKEYGPIVLSLKTTLRERWKQADLEGLMLKYVHRNSKTYLLTLSDEANNINRKIGERTILGINEAIICSSKEFDNLINYLKTLELYVPEKIETITSKGYVK